MHGDTVHLIADALGVTYYGIAIVQHFASSKT
jgi:hypothetical protein